MNYRYHLCMKFEDLFLFPMRIGIKQFYITRLLKLLKKETHFGNDTLSPSLKTLSKYKIERKWNVASISNICSEKERVYNWRKGEEWSWEFPYNDRMRNPCIWVFNSLFYLFFHSNGVREEGRSVLIVSLIHRLNSPKVRKPKNQFRRQVM